MLKCQLLETKYFNLLSPMLHTTHPGIGSALIQMPCSGPCSKGSPVMSD